MVDVLGYISSETVIKALAGLLAGALWYKVNRIDTRQDKTDEKLTELLQVVVENQSENSKTFAEIQKDNLRMIGSLHEKVNSVAVDLASLRGSHDAINKRI